MNLEVLRQALPKYAGDVKINISNVIFGEESALSVNARWAVMLASAYSTRHPAIFSAAENSAREAGLDDVHIEAAKTAATVMAMNNIYYRFLHLAHEAELSKMPARLRMQGLGNHGIDKPTFELMALAVSAINGCGMCIEAHVKEAQKHGLTMAAIQDVARIAAVINALAQAQSLAI